MATLKKVTPEKPLSTAKEKAYYPGFSLELKDIPEAKKWEVGSTHRLVVEVQMTSIREDENESRVGFDIKKVSPVKKDLKGDFIKMVKGGK